MRLRTRPNHALQPTPGSALCSATRFTSLGPGVAELFTLGRMKRKARSEAAFAWIEVLVVAAIVLEVASLIVRLRYSHAWLAAEYSFADSLVVVVANSPHVVGSVATRRRV
jgi:hypothetical protein